MSISLGAKSRQSVNQNDDGEKYYLVSVWLGLVMLIIWVICFIYIKKQAHHFERRRGEKLGISDFSIVIENMPTDFSRAEI